MVTTVERIKSVQAMMPILFVFWSLDFTYLTPGHFVTAKKQISGRMTLKKYIHTWVPTEVESGGAWSLLPQFGQK
jgi:hypothetical protein